MPSRSQPTTAFVLSRRAPAESFVPLILFCAELGVVPAFQRVSKKTVMLDLFDEAAVLLEGGGSGRGWFVKEAEVLWRADGVGQGYDRLQRAVAFANLVSKNPPPEESRPRMSALLRQAFRAFATSERPDAVYLKSIYCFARDEGYPVKEEWFATLANRTRELAAEVINTPLAGLQVSAAEVSRLTRKLEDYLRGYSELRLD